MSRGAVEWVAVGSAAGTLVALAVALALWWKLHNLRAAQHVLLEGGTRDFVDFAVSLHTRIDDLHRAVDEFAAGI